MKTFWTLLFILGSTTLTALASSPERTLVLRFRSDSLALGHLPFTLTRPDHYSPLEGQSDSLGYWRGELPATLTDKQVRLVVVSPFYASLDTLLDLSQAEHQIQLKVRETQLDGVQIRGIRRYNRGDALQQVFSFDPRSITRGTTLKAGLRMLPGVIALGDGYSLLGKNKQAMIQINGVEASEAELRLLSARAVDRVAIDATGSSGVINIILRQRNYQLSGDTELTVGTLPSASGSALFRYQDPHWHTSLSVDGGASSQSSRQRYASQATSPGATWDEDLSRRSSSCYLGSQLTLDGRIQWAPNAHWELGAGYKLFTYGGPLRMTLDQTPDRQLTYQSQQTTSVLNLVAKYIAPWGKWLLRGRRLHLGDRKEVRSLPASVAVRSLFDEWTYDLSFLTLPIRLSERIKQTWRWLYQGTARTFSLFPSDQQEQTYLHLLRITHQTQWEGVGKLYGYLTAEQALGYRRHKRWVWTPYVSFSSELGPISWALSYQQGIIRPISSQLNPTPSVEDYSLTKVGNPDLLDEHTQRLSLNLSGQFGVHYLSLAGGYSALRDGIQAVYVGDLHHQSYQNVGKLDSWTLAGGWSSSAFEGKLSWGLDISSQYGRYAWDTASAIGVMLPQRGWTLQGSANLSYVLGEAWFVEAYFQWNPYTLSTYSRSQNSPYYGATVNFTPQESRWSFRLGVASLSRQHTTTLLYTRSHTFRSENWSRVGGINLSISYSFGKQFRERSLQSFISTSDNQITTP